MKKIIIIFIILGISAYVLYTSNYLKLFNNQDNIDYADQLQEKGDYTQAINIAEKEAEKVKEPINYFYIAEIIYNSCTSDSDPRLIEAIRYYQLAINDGYIDAGIRIADIYNYCSLPEYGIPNKELARDLYEKIARIGIDTNVRMECAIKYGEMQKTRKVPSRDYGQINRIVPDPEIIQPKKIPEKKKERKIKIRNDSQNVHDTTVQRHIKHTIEKLRKLAKYNEYASNKKKTITEIREMINQAEILTKKKMLALKALNAIEKENIHIYNIDMTETEVLALVWNRCHSIENKYNIDNLKQNLINQLIDCIVNDKPVCSQGRISRVIMTLQKVDADESLGDIKPKWAVREELQQVVAKIRNDTLSQATDAEISAYNQDLETPDNERITQRIKDNIQKKTLEDYQITGILTEIELKKELEPLLAEI